MSASAMQISELGLKYAQPGYIGAKSGVLDASSAGIAAEAPLFGMRVAPYTNPRNGAVVNRPVALTRIRFKFMPSVAIATPQNVDLELHKTDSTANFTNGLVATAQRKKFSAYDPIPSTEIDIKIADTAPLSGGSHVLQEPEDHPFDMAGAFGATPQFESIWVADDGFPLVLEQNEGLILHLEGAIATGAGSFRIFVGIDFFRF